MGACVLGTELGPLSEQELLTTQPPLQLPVCSPLDIDAKVMQRILRSPVSQVWCCGPDHCTQGTETLELL